MRSLRAQVLAEVGKDGGNAIGVAVAEISARIAARRAEVDRAVAALCDEGAVVRFKGLTDSKTIRVALAHVLPKGHRVCVVCAQLFEVPKTPADKTGKRYKLSTRKTCSRTCHASYGWRAEASRAKRVESIRASKLTPKALAHVQAFNRERWSKPGAREALSRRNREAWSDPATKVALSVAIANAQRLDEARKRYSAIRRAWWQDPDNRARAIESMKGRKRKKKDE